MDIIYNKYDVIVIAGAPGTGKSTLAKKIQEDSGNPMFEFGWIPEYRNKPNGEIPYEKEEALSFENLILVTKNYLKNGFKGIVLTDLDDKRIPEIPNIFGNQKYLIVTLYLSNNETLKKRVLEPTRSSAYRNVEEAIEINNRIVNRNLLPNEIRFDAEKMLPTEILNNLKSR